MKLLTVRNRFPSKTFVGMFDGEKYEVKDTAVVPETVAYHLKKQSVIRDNPVTGEQEYRLNIVEEDGPGEDLESLPVESLDRSDFPTLRKVEYLQTNAKPAVPVKTDSGSPGVLTSSK